MKKKIVLFCILAVILFCGYFLFLGSYPLLDVDETRYVDMARSMLKSGNFLTLYLNGDYFFEKPPLYFWIECFAFKIFGGTNELTARLPIVLLSLLPLGLLFGICKKVKDIKYAFITCAVLLTSLEYILITKIAILDSVLTSLVSSAVLCYFYTFFTENKNKKYFWCLTYIFTGLAVMAKGIPGLVIPAGTIAVSTIIFKTYRETFKYAFAGIILFLIIVLPWHILMLKTYPGLFFEEYIYKHHILRFLGSDVIHRSQPWYFYILTLLWGLFPHIFVFLPKFFAGIFKKIKTQNINFIFNQADSLEKFLILNTITVLVSLLFFSSSGAKLITYILPVYPFFAAIIANMWLQYINNDNRTIKVSLIILNTILLTSAFVMCFAKFVLPSYVYKDFLPVQIISLILIVPFTIVNLCLILKNKKFENFISTVIFISLLSGCLTPFIYKFDYSFGQNDLMKFAKFAKENNYTISTYKTGKKYSLLYYSGLNRVEFQIDDDLNWLDKELHKRNHLVITRNKDLKNLPVKVKVKGVKYSVIEKI